MLFVLMENDETMWEKFLITEKIAFLPCSIAFLFQAKKVYSHCIHTYMTIFQVLNLRGGLFFLLEMINQ